MSPQGVIQKLVNDLHRNGCRRFIVDYTGQKKKKKIISIVEECQDPASLQKISTLSSTYTSTKKGRITVNLFCTELEKKKHVKIKSIDLVPSPKMSL